jgi:hypothetical protein
MIRILWVDDDEARREGSQTLGNPVTGLEVDFQRPEPVAKANFELRDYAIVLIDARLDELRGPDEAEKFDRKGFALAAQLHQRSPLTPMYGFSDQPLSLVEISRLDSSSAIFDRLLRLSDLFAPSASRELQADALDYTAMRTGLPGGPKLEEITRYVPFLRPPENEIPAVTKIITSDFLGGRFGRMESYLGFARWVRSVLLTVPGPVKATEYMAPLLGLTEKGFTKVREALAAAAYRGVFGTSSGELWWGTEVEHQIAERMTRRPAVPGVLSSMADVAFSLEASDRVNCVVCGLPYPELVATTEVERRPRAAHVRCSRHHPSLPDRLYFDEPRVYTKS